MFFDIGTKLVPGSEPDVRRAAEVDGTAARHPSLSGRTGRAGLTVGAG